MERQGDWATGRLGDWIRRRKSKMFFPPIFLSPSPRRPVAPSPCPHSQLSTSRTGLFILSFNH
jgi:hypothetical protein